MAERSILAVAYTPVSSARTLRATVGGFLKYIQHRDQHPDSQSEVEGLLKYVAHRDRTGSRARLFNRDGQVTDENRRWLATYVSRSVAGLPAGSSRDQGNPQSNHVRAVYRFVISPEYARGLDLRQLARAAMGQLEADAGGLGPWLAAEHRNTAHPHIHIVLAARREITPGRFKTVVVTRPRLQRMKAAMMNEISRRRELERRHEPGLPACVPQLCPTNQPRTWKARPRRRRHFLALRSTNLRHPRHHYGATSAVLTLRALAAHYRRQMERDLEDEVRRREREGWIR